MIRGIYVATTGCALMLFLASAGSAAPLSGHPDAYNDGTSWTGAVSLVNLPLEATLEYAVFTAADFTANFGGSGYVPSDSLVYTYQIFGIGSQAVTAEIVGISNPVSNIGTFQINASDIDASSAAITTNAVWEFSPGIGAGETSYGLAFSSPNAPMANGPSLTVAEGTSGTFSVLNFGVPTPGSIAIPEPATLALSMLASSAVLLSRRRRIR